MTFFPLKMNNMSTKKVSFLKKNAYKVGSLGDILMQFARLCEAEDSEQEEQIGFDIRAQAIGGVMYLVVRWHSP